MNEAAYAAHVVASLRAGRRDLTRVVAEPVEHALAAMVRGSLAAPCRRAPVAEAPAVCRPSAWSLEHLISSGYSMHYVVCRFATATAKDWTPPTHLEVEGVELQPIRFVNFEEYFRHKAKPLKTQVNWELELRHVVLASAVFAKARAAFSALECASGNFLFPQFSGLPPDQWVAPPLPRFVCAVSGRIRFCECARPWIEARRAKATSDCQKGAGSAAHAELRHLAEIAFVDGICHLCVARAAGRDEMITRYGTDVLVDHRVYVEQLAFIHGLTRATARADVEALLCISRWRRETELYAMVRKLFSDQEIQREAQPPWLGRLRLDVYVPALRLAFEHMGTQHAEPVAFFGGETAHRRTVERDRAKRELCAANGVTVIDIGADEAITLASLRRRVGSRRT